MRPASICLIGIILLLTPFLAGQTESETQRELRKAQAVELAKKSLADLDSIRLPENKITVEVAALGVIAAADKETARRIVADMVEQYMQFASSAQAAHGNARFMLRNEAANLRRTIAGSIAHVDPSATLAFLQSTKPAYLNNNDRMQENALMDDVATQVANEDPAAALKMAEENLQDGVSYGAANLIQPLLQKDPIRGQEFVSKLVSQIKASDLVENQQSLFVALNVLQNLTNLGDETKRSAAFSRQLTDLAKTISDALLDPKLQPQMLFQMGGYNDLLKKYAPAAAVQIHERLEQLQQSAEGNAMDGGWGEFQRLVNAGDGDKVLQYIAAQPAENRDNFYSQYASMLASNGKSYGQAAGIIQTYVKDPDTRANSAQNLAQQGLYQAASQGDVKTALGLLDAMDLTAEERATQLA